MSVSITGIGISDGIGMGYARWIQNQLLTEHPRTVMEQDPQIGLELFRSAVKASKNELLSFLDLKQNQENRSVYEVLEAHLHLFEDPMLISKIEDRIRAGVSVHESILQTQEELLQFFEAIEDEYLRERSTDIRDLCKRLLLQLQNKHDPLETDYRAGVDSEINSSSATDQWILISNEITPTDFLKWNGRIKGMVTCKGSAASHVSILARSFAVPTISGVTEEQLNTICEGDYLILDGTNGVLHINPDPKLLKDYAAKHESEHAKQIELLKLKELKAETMDGASVKLLLNIGSGSEVTSLAELGADGIGLFRTELFFGERTELPSEEEQFEIYKQVIAEANDKPVIIRTIDIGGDKMVSYLSIPHEENPFLGLRGIRLCFRYPELLKVQLRALLRASIFGQLKILIPMISHIEQIRNVKQWIQEARSELLQQGISISHHIPVGMMVEVPSVVPILDLFAKEVDFFSIGTNDLVQYTLAVDRLNEHVSELYDSFHPAILRMIHQIIQMAHKFEKKVCICGEMAGDPISIPILMAMGIDELSMNPSRILSAKRTIRNLDAASSHQELKLREILLSAATGKEVRQMIARENQCFA